MRKFVLGLVLGLVVLAPLCAYLYVKLGMLSLATTAKPFPMELLLAKTALRADIGNAKNRPDPLPVNNENLEAGAKLYHEECAVCHGQAGQPKTDIAAGMFPKPPQLLAGKGVTDDPEGETFWKITKGIRMSGMPRFDGLSETQRWQITMLLKHANDLPQGVQAQLR